MGRIPRAGAAGRGHAAPQGEGGGAQGAAGVKFSWIDSRRESKTHDLVKKYHGWIMHAWPTSDKKQSKKTKGKKPEVRASETTIQIHF